MLSIGAICALFPESARTFLSAHEQALSSLGGGRRRFVLGIAAHVAGPEVPICWLV